MQRHIPWSLILTKSDPKTFPILTENWSNSDIFWLLVYMNQSEIHIWTFCIKGNSDELPKKLFTVSLSVNHQYLFSMERGKPLILRIKAGARNFTGPVYSVTPANSSNISFPCTCQDKNFGSNWKLVKVYLVTKLIQKSSTFGEWVTKVMVARHLKN